MIHNAVKQSSIIRVNQFLQDNDMPLLTLTPDCRDGCEAAETTRPEPALEGVRKEKVLSALVRAYHVEALHDVAA